MTVKETIKILSVLKSNYANLFKSMNTVDMEGMINLWADMFKDVDYQLVSNAVRAYIQTDTTGYIPTIGKINELIRKNSRQGQMTEQEAINLISKATSNSTYNAESEFNKLPPILQRLVGSPNQLRVWALMPADEFSTVIASNLMRSYKVMAKDEELQQVMNKCLTTQEHLKIGGETNAI